MGEGTNNTPECNQNDKHLSVICIESHLMAPLERERGIHNIFINICALTHDTTSRPLLPLITFKFRYYLSGLGLDVQSVSLTSIGILSLKAEVTCINCQSFVTLLVSAATRAR